MKRQNAVARIIRPFKERLKLQRLYVAFKFGAFGGYLLYHGDILFFVRHFDKRFNVFRMVDKLLIFVYLRHQRFNALIHLVGVFNVVPKAFFPHLPFKLVLFPR